MKFTQQIWHVMKIMRFKLFFIFKSTSGCELTISKCLSNIVLHFQYIGRVDTGGIHELTLVGTACQLTEEVHQIEETGGTPAHGHGKCEKYNLKKRDHCITYKIIKQG